MLNLVAILGLLILSAHPGDGAAPVRIGLFGLFKPEALHARVTSGGRATLDTGTVSGDRAIAPGEVIRIRLVSNHLNVTISDSFGRVVRSFNTARARILPSGSATVELIIPGKMDRAVRGEVIVAPRDRSPRGGLSVVLATDRESAAASVVAAEIGGERSVEAIKALAVVVRTFMLSHAGRHADEGFDFCDTTHCQLYKGESHRSGATSPVISNAVAATVGEFLSFANRPLATYFTAVCGGLSATPSSVWGGRGDGSYAYRRVACRWCRASRYNKWERAANASLALDALSSAAGLRLSRTAEIIVNSFDESGLVRSVIIRDAGRQITMSADEFRRAIGRKLGWSTVLSPTFTVERRGPSLIFRGKGFGSQVGLCLAGTVAQAVARRGYREILSFYYPQTEVRVLSAHE
ncbi:MAG TPA: SpoIID/LytB domain-containing protein [Blastocatellia bacterium]|nr:SpoIID/LytB domain-containing protein [Blastocatellia bacterium]